MHIRLTKGENTIERLETACDLASTLPARFVQKTGRVEDDSILKTPVLLTVAR